MPGSRKRLKATQRTHTLQEHHGSDPTQRRAPRKVNVHPKQGTRARNKASRVTQTRFCGGGKDSPRPPHHLPQTREP